MSISDDTRRKCETAIQCWDRRFASPDDLLNDLLEILSTNLETKDTQS